MQSALAAGRLEAERGSARVRLLIRCTWYTILVYHAPPCERIRCVTLFRMLRRLLRTLLLTPAPLDGATSRAAEPLRRVDELEARIVVLERAETLRAAEHAAMVDQLERLYKRIAARIARENGSQSSGESVLDLKQRLKGQ